MSNYTNDPWETEMSRTFDQRVRDLNEAPLNLDQVKGKAVRIRRNRRIAVAGGVLAAAAVIVPVAVIAGNGLNDNDSGPGFADPDPSPTATDPEGLDFGYLEGKTLHLADGSTVQLPQRYDSGVLLGESLYAVRNDDETGYDQLDVIDANGTRTVATDVVSGPVMNDDNTMLAYLQRDGSLSVEAVGSGAAFSTDLGDGSFISAVTGGPDCETGDCRIYVNGEFGTQPLVFDANGGSQPADVPGALKVNDVNEDGLVTVQNGSTDTGSCGGVYDLTNADYVWETCERYLYDLSPGSAYVNATHPYLDGIGNAYASILDAATGEEIIQFDPPEGFIAQTVWQDAEHLLALVYDSEGWSIFRIGADKTIEQVVGPNPKGSDLNPSYALLGQP